MLPFSDHFFVFSVLFLFFFVLGQVFVTSSFILILLAPILSPFSVVVSWYWLFWFFSVVICQNHIFLVTFLLLFLLLIFMAFLLHFFLFSFHFGPFLAFFTFFFFFFPVPSHSLLFYRPCVLHILLIFGGVVLLLFVLFYLSPLCLVFLSFLCFLSFFVLGPVFVASSFIVPILTITWCQFFDFLSRVFLVLFFPFLLLLSPFFVFFCTYFGPFSYAF
mgnify:CR=1 FL=1